MNNRFIFCFRMKSFKEMFQFYIVCTILIVKCNCMIGYECGTRAASISTVSLLEVGECNFKAPEVTNSPTYAQLLQLNEFEHTKVYQCKIVVDRLVHYCGMHSHISIVNKGNAVYLREIERTSCLDLFKTGRLHFDGDHVIDGIRINATVNQAVTLAGRINDDGSCKGVSYTDPFGSWNDVIVSAKIQITLHEQIVRVDADNDKIHLPSGTVCKLSDTHCIDSLNGHSFWDNLPIDYCNFRKYGLLTEGMMEKITELGTNKVAFKLTDFQVSFALLVTHEENICGFKILRTEHPKLFIFETTKDKKFASPNRIDRTNLDLFLYFNSKFLYVEKHVKAQMKHLYYDILIQQCRIEQEVIRNSLALSTLSPDLFAYNLKKEPGYLALLAGEVIHIVKCTPVEVKLQRTDECYAELRVSYKNETWFLTPRTHILKSTGTLIDCNPILAPQYQIDAQWYKMLQQPVAVKDPVKIQPQSKDSWTYQEIEFLATSGIYTDKDLDNIRNTIMFPVEKQSVLSDFARELNSGNSFGTGTLSKFFSDETIEKIVDSYWNRLWQKFITFGTVSAGLISILVIIHIIKSIVDIILNGVALHKVYGFSYHLVAAIWNSLTHFLIMVGTNAQQTYTQVPQGTAPPEIELTESNVQSIGTELESQGNKVYPEVPPSKQFFTLPK